MLFVLRFAIGSPLGIPHITYPMRLGHFADYDLDYLYHMAKSWDTL